MLAWYLLYSKPKQERVALENLERQGYEAYLPLMPNRRRIKGRYTRVIEPMFPRYLFIHLSDKTDDWGPIRSTLGVSKLVRFGDLPARVPEGLIETLQSHENEAGIQVLPLPEFKAGDRVRIAEGAMAGYEGVYQAKGSQERVIILLDVVGKSTRVQLSADAIEAVK